MPPARPYSRRQLLARAGAVAVGGLLAGCSSDDSEPRIPGVEFSRVVDVREEGGDASGDESITSVLDDVTEDDTLLYFPEGEYFVEGSWRPPSSVRKLGILGPDATIRPAEGYDGFMLAIGEHDRMDEFYVRGPRFDFSTPETGARAIQAKVRNRLRVQDVELTGRHDTDQNAFSFNVLSADGDGRIERLSMRDGGVPGGNAVGCLVTSDNRGHLVFENCSIGGFPNNGLYASPSKGRIDVVGGEYFNNDIANVRVSGPSLVRDVAVWCDTDDDANRNMRGIRLKSGRGVIVDGCSVDIRQVPYSDGAITLARPLQSAVVRETNINVDSDGVPALRLKPHSCEGRECRFRGENVSITGSAATGSAVRIVERNGSLLTRTRIEQSGADRDGVHVINSQNVVVRDGYVSVPGDPFVTENSSLERKNVMVRS